MKSISPIDYSVIGYVDESTQQEIRTKVKKAQSAKLKWKELGMKKRISLLQRLFPAIKKRKKEIIALITKEMGKPISEARSEYEYLLSHIKMIFEVDARYLEDILLDDKGKHRIMFEPYGVTAAILPWNFPFSLFSWCVVTHLVAGNNR